jgi:3-isopropylmalate/(R)-2-methylmalate dehydratase small subunit
MEAFIHHTGFVLPLDRANVDTDAIIPKQYLKSTAKSGYGAVLFDDWRYLDPGEPGMDHRKRRLNPDFILNQPPYQGATILLARQNFGCGSSREHAVWALVDYGFRVVIAPSFADIFYNNAASNGLLLIVLGTEEVNTLFQEANQIEGYTLTIDLLSQTIQSPLGTIFTFPIEARRKKAFLEGLDDVDLILKEAERIRLYEEMRQVLEPWIFL